MTALFERRASLVVGTTRIDGLRLSFSVEKKGAREPNKATISVSNLSPATRAAFDAKAQRIVLEAGYAEQFGAIFIGSSYATVHQRDGADFVTTISAADGGKEVSAKTTSFSYRAGASTTAIIRAAVAALGLPLSTGSRITPSTPTMRNGYAFVGLAADALDALTAANGLTWSVQDGQVQILDAVPGDGVGAVLLSGNSGMEGSPERADVKDEKTGVVKKRVQVKCRIQPRIRPERKIQVVSADVPQLSGLYVAKGIKITGDTHGADWTMTIQAKPL